MDQRDVDDDHERIERQGDDDMPGQGERVEGGMKKYQAAMPDRTAQAIPGRNP